VIFARLFILANAAMRRSRFVKLECSRVRWASVLMGAGGGFFGEYCSDSSAPSRVLISWSVPPCASYSFIDHLLAQIALRRRREATANPSGD